MIKGFNKDSYYFDASVDFFAIYKEIVYEIRILTRISKRMTLIYFTYI